MLLETGTPPHRVKTEKDGEEVLLVCVPDRTHSRAVGGPGVARALSYLFIYSPLPGFLPEGKEWMKGTHKKSHCWENISSHLELRSPGMNPILLG